MFNQLVNHDLTISQNESQGTRTCCSLLTLIWTESKPLSAIVDERSGARLYPSSKAVDSRVGRSLITAVGCDKHKPRYHYQKATDGTGTRVKFLDHKEVSPRKADLLLPEVLRPSAGKKDGKRLPLNFWRDFFAQGSELNRSGPSCSGGGTERISTHAEENRRDLVTLENSGLLKKPHPERKEALVGADAGRGIFAGEGLEI